MLKMQREINFWHINLQIKTTCDRLIFRLLNSNLKKQRKEDVETEKKIEEKTEK